MQQVDRIRNGPGTILSRAQLEIIQEDPAAIETLARVMGAVNLENLFIAMQLPSAPVASRIEFQKLLNKMGKLEPQAGATTNQDKGFSITINLPGTAQIEAKRTPVTIDEDED